MRWGIVERELGDHSQHRVPKVVFVVQLLLVTELMLHVTECHYLDDHVSLFICLLLLLVDHRRFIIAFFLAI